MLEKIRTGNTVKAIVNMRVDIVYIAKYLVLRKDAYMASSPSVGRSKNGVGENTIRAVFKSGLFITEEIGPAHSNKNAEKIAPKMKNIFVTLFIMLFAYSCGCLGRKYAYALGKPNVNIVRRELYTYITCLYVP